MGFHYIEDDLPNAEVEDGTVNIWVDSIQWDRELELICMFTVKEEE